MISPDEAGQAWERIKGYITNREAEIVHEERWGTRRLAYPVKKGQYQFLEGNYHLTRFTTDQAFNRDLENYLKLDDQVLRSLVTITVSEEELAAHAAQTRAPRPPRPPAGAPPAGAPPAGAPPAWGTAGWGTAGWGTVGWRTTGWGTTGWGTAGWGTAGWGPSGSGSSRCCGTSG
jgi:ribosomal protein S6